MSDYITALNKLSIKRKGKWNTLNKEALEYIPVWAQTEDFMNEFLPYLTIVGDSREQKDWIGSACDFYGIDFIPLKKDEKLGTENLKEGDYSFIISFDDKQYNFVNKVAYERKGSLSEIYNNCTQDRARFEREFERCFEKGYKKVVLILEYGERIQDLICAEFSYGKGKNVVTKNTGTTIFNTLMSWRQSNKYNIDIYQSPNHITLFWLMVQDMYYFFRNEIIREAKNDKGSKEGEGQEQVQMD